MADSCVGILPKGSDGVGRRQRRLTDNGADDRHRRHVRREDGRPLVDTLALGESILRRQTDHLADDGYPSRSPDGRSIASGCDWSGSFDVRAVPAAGGDPVRPVDDAEQEQAPRFVPR